MELMYQTFSIDNSPLLLEVDYQVDGASIKIRTSDEDDYISPKDLIEIAEQFKEIATIIKKYYLNKIK